MPDGDAPAAIPVLRCGAIAREILADAGETRVLAVFERSFYLACPRGIVCIGTADIGAGPINVEVALPIGVTWPQLGVMPDAEGETSGSTCRIGDGFALAVDAGATWFPPPLPDFDAARVAGGVARLRACVRPLELPDEGLACLIFEAADHRKSLDRTARAAQVPMATLSRAIPRALAADAWSPDALQAATLLVGLGPGFTPSGDDVLGGLMLALTAAGRTTLRDALWRALRPELDDLTVPASAMHLSAAADGMGSESVHLLLNAILLDTSDVGPRLGVVARIGHTSGWDCLVGLVLGLEAAASPAIPPS